ncbi:hypothetical protein LWS67_23560, partial [Bacillus atrophaeus]|nr:hypothetical protein [Bacillus atrophaeus]
MLSVCLGQVLPTLASPYPGSGAPLFAARQVQPEGDPANPFSYPFLLNIAESLARQNGFPYFLGLDGKAGPGIDLRMIL